MARIVQDLSGFNGSFPKPLPKGKKPKKPISPGNRTLTWEQGRKELKALFKEKGIITCELMLDSNCKKNNFLGFAHIRPRRYLTEEQLIDYHFVVLACQNCHYSVDFSINRAAAEKIMQNIVDRRGW